MRMILLAGTLACLGCTKSAPTPQTTTSALQTTTNTVPFAFIVEEVFYIKPPVDRVILVGTVNSGTVRVGDSLLVNCQGTDVPAELDVIETIDRGPLQQAGAGEQVGLRLIGIRSDQPKQGDRVTRKPPNK